MGIEKLLGGLFDKEEATQDIIQNALQNVAQELECSHNDVFIMIKPKNEDFEPRFLIYKTENNSAPKYIRDITIKEILSD